MMWWWNPVPSGAVEIDVVRIYLGSLLGAMAIGQALGWKAYRDAVASYRLGRLTGAAVVGLFGLEVAVAVGSLTNLESVRLPAGILGVVVTVAWTAIALRAYVRRHDVPNCGCFGPFFRQKLRWWVLLEDAAFVGLAVLYLRGVA